MSEDIEQIKAELDELRRIVSCNSTIADMQRLHTATALMVPLMRFDWDRQERAKEAIECADALIAEARKMKNDPVVPITPHPERHWYVEKCDELGEWMAWSESKNSKERAHQDLSAYISRGDGKKYRLAFCEPCEEVAK